MTSNITDNFNRLAQSEIVTKLDLDRADGGRSGLVFDVTKYMGFVEGMDLTEGQARQMLEAIWSIVVGFVDLGFGVHPVQQAMDKSQKLERRSTEAMVSLLTENTDINIEETVAQNARAPRGRGIHEPQ